MSSIRSLARKVAAFFEKTEFYDTQLRSIQYCWVQLYEVASLSTRPKKKTHPDPDKDVNLANSNC